MGKGVFCVDEFVCMDWSAKVSAFCVFVWSSLSVYERKGEYKWGKYETVCGRYLCGWGWEDGGVLRMPMSVYMSVVLCVCVFCSCVCKRVCKFEICTWMGEGACMPVWIRNPVHIYAKNFTYNWVSVFAYEYSYALVCMKQYLINKEKWELHSGNKEFPNCNRAFVYLC